MWSSHSACEPEALKVKAVVVQRQPRVGALLQLLARPHADGRVVGVDNAARKHLRPPRVPREHRAVQQVEPQLAPRLDLAGKAPQRVVREGELLVLAGRRVGEDRWHARHRGCGAVSRRLALSRGQPHQWPVPTVEHDVDVGLLRVPLEHLQQRPRRRLVAPGDAARLCGEELAADDLVAHPRIFGQVAVRPVGVLEKHRRADALPATQVLAQRRD
eukprot:1509395-Prymnesium_polylepis.1